MGAGCQEPKSPARVGLYVDGFNLYHAIDDLGEPFLKWCNLRRLGECIISPRSQVLVRVAVCTAYYPDHPQRRFRHERYNEALRLAGVDVVMGHYVYEDMDCRNCNHAWRKPTEKESDINLALSVFDDAHMDVIDHAFLMSADSDQAATARMFAARFPHKRLFSISPPGRRHSAHVLKYTRSHIALNKDHLERALFRHAVRSEDEKSMVLRPREYAPPEGYVHWDDRARKAEQVKKDT